MMSDALTYAKQERERFKRELHDFLRIPSISTDPTYKEQVSQAADWLVAHLKNIGLEAERINTDGHPLVYAEWLEAGEGAPTVLIYGHYDVQPVDPLDLWETPPFEPSERDGKIYARGATDDKGQLFIHIKAVEALMKAEGRLPINVKFLLEGEEESGSRSISAFVPANKDKLKADVCVVSDSSMPSPDRPKILHALRGILAMELHVSGPKGDLHSGMYGGTVHNPAQAIAEIVTKLHNEDGSVAVPGFYDDVLPLDDVERSRLAETPADLAEWREKTGAPAPWGEPDYSLRERIGARPTLEVNGISGGYTAEGFKTVIPAKAIAKLSCRLVAKQDAHRIYEQIRDYIASITPHTVHSELIMLDSGPWALIDINTPPMQAAVKAYKAGFGAEPIFSREGGSIPIVAGFQAVLDTPVVMMGFGLDTDNLHAPNEHMVIDQFYKGIDTAIHFYKALVEQA